MSIINATAADFNTLSVSMSRMEQNLGGEITARLLGFLRPPQVWENTREQLRICVSHSAATLRLDSLTSHLVCKLQSSNFHSYNSLKKLTDVGSVKKSFKVRSYKVCKTSTVELKLCSAIRIKILDF